MMAGLGFSHFYAAAICLLGNTSPVAFGSIGIPVVTLAGIPGLPQQALTRSWASLKEVGNLSSASVLFVLGETMESPEPRPGDWGIMMAMGPGFCAELVLLRW